MKKKLVIVNCISFIRIMGIFIIPFLFMNKLAIPTIVVAGLVFLTDFIDGFLARKWKVCTFFGALLDSIADKLLIYTIILLLVFKYPLLYIPVFLLEIVIVLISIKKSFNGYHIESSKMGKIKTAIVFIGIFLSYVVLGATELNEIVTSTSLKFFINNEDTIIICIASLIILAELIAILSYTSNDMKDLSYKKTKLHLVKNRKIILKYALSPEYFYENKNASQAKLVENIIKKAS